MKSVTTPFLHPRPPPVSRPRPVIVKPDSVTHLTIEEISKLRLPEGWIIFSSSETSMQIGFIDQMTDDSQIKFLVEISKDFQLRIELYGFIVTDFGFDLQKLGITKLCQELGKSNICKGITEPSLQCFHPTASTIKASKQKNSNSFSKFRSTSCVLLVMDGEQCRHCGHFSSELQTRLAHEQERSTQPLHKNTPLSSVKPERLVMEVKKEQG